MRALALLRSAAGTVALVAILAVAGLMLIPAAFGLDRYVITSGSMAGTYDMGSIVLAERVPVTSLRTGDVITYAPPAGAAPTALVTHRIVSILPGPDAGSGKRVFVTKGDANNANDDWTFTLDSATQAKVTASVPQVGKAFILLGDPRARVLLIGVPAALIALLTLLGLVRDVRADRRMALTA